MIDVFKTEIIEAEKSRTDLLKWKLIIVATLGAVGLGIDPEDSGSTSAVMSPILALSLIPLAATYVDLLCKHLQLRILVVSEFFQKCTPNEEIPGYFIDYEKFCGEKRRAFDLEDWAQVYSTVVLSVLVPLVAASRLRLCEGELWVIFASGSIGLLSSWLISQKVKILKAEITS